MSNLPLNISWKVVCINCGYKAHELVGQIVKLEQNYLQNYLPQMTSLACMQCGQTAFQGIIEPATEQGMPSSTSTVAMASEDPAGVEFSFSA